VLQIRNRERKLLAKVERSKNRLYTGAAHCAPIVPGGEV